MPLYEYICASCQKRTEILQRLGETPATECPSCGGALRKLISAPAFQFKGSGWYLTDYANRSVGDSGTSKGDGSQSSGETGSDEKGSASEGTDTKPAPAKSEAAARKGDASAPSAVPEKKPATTKASE